MHMQTIVKFNQVCDLDLKIIAWGKDGVVLN